MSKWIRLWLLIAACALAACVEDGGGPEIFVIVHETNLPDERPRCAHSYPLEVTRTCDGTIGSMRVCSSIELCATQLDSIRAAVAACTQPEGAVAVGTLPTCP